MLSKEEWKEKRKIRVKRKNRGRFSYPKNGVRLT